MALTDIDGAEASDLQTAMEAGDMAYSIPSETTDAGGEEKEYSWQMQDWSENLGYYKKIPELKTAVDAKASWLLGAGYEADEETTLLLMGIKGNGKDSFNSILKNLCIVRDIAGDSFAEVIADDKGKLANLKPLDPSTIKVIHNSRGMIKRYEQTSKINKKSVKKFEPEEIFHLSRNRVADEIHGESIINSVKEIILARNESIQDWRKVLHRNVVPLVIWHLDTDDSVEIAAFKAKNDAARADGENIYIPKGTVEPEIVATAQNATLNPQTWINQLNDYFFQTVNVPQIIIGNAKEFTDASSKIVYLAFEQTIKAEQLYMEEQILNQLSIEINLRFPASLQNEMVSDQPAMEANEQVPGQEMGIKEERPGQPIEPNDKKLEAEGRQ